MPRLCCTCLGQKTYTAWIDWIDWIAQVVVGLRSVVWQVDHMRVVRRVAHCVAHRVAHCVALSRHLVRPHASKGILRSCSSLSRKSDTSQQGVCSRDVGLAWARNHARICTHRYSCSCLLQRNGNASHRWGWRSGQTRCST